MYTKIIGAVLIVSCCGGYGMFLAANHRKDVLLLHELVRALDVMICELEYRLTPLPELCRNGGQTICQPLQGVFLQLAETLQNKTFPDVQECMQIVLQQNKSLSQNVKHQLYQFGQTLGRFDLTGQLRGLAECKQECLLKLNELENNQQQRLRSYQTLGFCAGAALAILLF